jgi:hypothetical protein
MSRRTNRSNSKSAGPLATRYAALKTLVEIANRVHAEGREADFVALARLLARAQQDAGMDANLRIGETALVETPEGGCLAVARPFLRTPRFAIPIGEFYWAAVDMRGTLVSIVDICQGGSALRYEMIDVIRLGPLWCGVKPDFTFDPGFELFAGTLRLALIGRDLRRIRLCPECPRERRRLFVAVPSDRVACSPECASAQRVHKFLAEHPGYYAQEQRDKRRKIKSWSNKSSGVTPLQGSQRNRHKEKVR